MPRGLQERTMRYQRRLPATDLSERVTVRHYEQREDTRFGGSERVVAWSESLWAAVERYDQWVGQRRERDQVEFTGVELMFTVRRDTINAHNTADIVAADEIDWQDRTFVVAHIDTTNWADALDLYVEAKS